MFVAGWIEICAKSSISSVLPSMQNTCLLGLHDLQGETLASGNMTFQSKVIEYLISTSHGESINIYLLNDSSQN